ncbi:hypothetical protein BCR44DRAFT_1456632 [Catenaria anguillulae PL171]|uniref:Uncharacterized protein n=1 Tax=Catenaria anguillulae PL171 TaxID=765915 RepID=A0A1Y2GH71_9FUNG|nr:hypothetical protein BCR44DRAFT_1456632 [Catenaria anguillulae PL171]
MECMDECILPRRASLGANLISEFLMKSGLRIRETFVRSRFANPSLVTRQNFSVAVDVSLGAWQWQRVGLPAATAAPTPRRQHS